MVAEHGNENQLEIGEARCFLYFKTVSRKDRQRDSGKGSRAKGLGCIYMLGLESYHVRHCVPNVHEGGSLSLYLRHGPTS